MVSRVMSHCPHGAVRRARWPVGCECPAGAKLPEVSLELVVGGTLPGVGVCPKTPHRVEGVH